MTYFRSIVTLFITTGVTGRSCGRSGRCRFSRRRPGPRRPRRRRSGVRSRCGVGPSVMKNWLPLVFGPALAIERMPARSWRSVGMELVLELIARAAGALPERIAALDHEAVDDAVEDDAVVERRCCASAPSSGASTPSCLRRGRRSWRRSWAPCVSNSSTVKLPSVVSKCA